MDLHVQPAQSLQGEFEVPGDKSISHRSMILGAIADGQTIVHGFLEGKDCLATMDAMRACGVDITYPKQGPVVINGVGLHGLRAPKDPIDCGNSGTSMRLLAGLFAAQPFDTTLIGDRSLSHRPMQRIIKPLTEMGAKIAGQSAEDDNLPPLHIKGGQSLRAIQYTVPVASSQVKSCILLAALYAKGKTLLVENVPTRDHSERMLKSFGCDLNIERNSMTLTPPERLQAQEIYVPGDISSAAFFIAGASFVPGAHIVIKNVGVNPRRTGIITILREMGADITLHHERLLGEEPVADIEVRGKELHGIEVPREHNASAIDEFPVIFVAAAAAKGETTIRGIQELRFKETDRIAAMAQGFKELGVACAILPDGIVIRGSAPFNGGIVNSHGDHRIAMAFAIASLIAKAPIQIIDCDNIATSFPNFCELGNKLGLSIKSLNPSLRT